MRNYKAILEDNSRSSIHMNETFGDRYRVIEPKDYIDGRKSMATLPGEEGEEMRIPAYCFCYTCNKRFDSLGIARHRSMHRDKKEKCRIIYSTGKCYIHDFRDEKKVKK